MAFSNFDVLIKKPRVDAGFPVNTQHVRLMYIQFRLCVHVNVKRTNIFHKYSEYYIVRAPRFKNNAVVQKSCSISSAFHSSKAISKLYLTDFYEKIMHITAT